ncbi:hypothetical protein [Spirosoma pomorum]
MEDKQPNIPTSLGLDLVRSLIADIPPQDYGKSVMETSNDSQVKQMHDGLKGVNENERQWNDYKQLAKVIEAELTKRGISYKPLDW